LAKFRVYEVAEELGIESSHLIQMLREMDVPVRSHMSTVDPPAVRHRRGAGDGADASRSASRKRSPRRTSTTQRSWRPSGPLAI
jgi:translation initiation factor IF-2